MNNSELQQRKQRAIARGEGNAYNVYIKRAKNAELWDVEGKRYIDFGSGIAVVNTGHCHPKVTAAVKEQQEQRAIQHQVYIASIEAMRKQAEKERQAQQQLLGMNDPLNEGSPSEAFAPLTMPEPENAQESIDWWNKNIATPNDPLPPPLST